MSQSNKRSISSPVSGASSSLKSSPRLVVQCGTLDWVQGAVRKRQEPVETALALGSLKRRPLARSLRLSRIGVLGTANGDVGLRIIDVKEVVLVPAKDRAGEIDMLVRLSTGRHIGAATVIERANPWSVNRHEVTVYAGTFDVNQRALGKSERLLRDIGIVCMRWFWFTVPEDAASQNPVRKLLGPSALRTGGKPLPGFDF